MTASSAGREPPHNFEAGQALLGAIMVNSAAFSQASEILSPQHFADPLHSRLYEALGRFVEHGQVVSALTLKAYAEADEGLKAVGGAASLARLMTASVHAVDVRVAARTVRECAILDVPALALSQLSRAVDQRPDKRPQLADLRDSGSIEQDADVVIFIYREEHYLERGSPEDRARLGDVAGRAELHVIKQRHGPTGLVRVMFDGPTARFSDVDRSDR
jgi:replicative DNA helicase